MRRAAQAALLCAALYLVLGFLLPPLFRQTGEVPSPEEASGGARVLSLDENGEALQWRLQAIGQAQEEIVLTTFKLEDDGAGRAVMAALREAAEDGVQIRILIDGLNGLLHLWGSETFHALASMENVQVRFYNPVDLLTPWRLNYRLHDKYLIVDDTIYITGGRNTNDLSLAESPEANRDRDILVYETEPGDDTSLSQLRDYFETVWAISEEKTYRRSAAHLAAGFSQLTAAYTPPEEADLFAATVEAVSVTIASNSAQAWNKAPDLWQYLCTLMEAGTDITIQTPYVICSRPMYDDLTALCQGRNVALVINSPATGANPWGSTDYLNQRRRIWATGVETYLWYGTQSSHAKTILIDDSISIIGSYNLDMRSTYLDTELMVVIDCPALNTQLRAQMAQMQAESICIQPDGTEHLGADCQVAALSPARSAVYTLLRAVILPFRYLL